MKNYKIFSLGLIILNLVIISCASYSSQESFSSSFVGSRKNGVDSSSITGELSPSTFSSSKHSSSYSSTSSEFSSSFIGSRESSISSNLISSKSSSSSIEQPQYKLNPVSEYLMKRFLTIYDADVEPDPQTNMPVLYSLYKNGNSSDVYLYKISAENLLHCYYIPRDAYGEYLNPSIHWRHSLFHGLIPSSPLTDFMAACNAGIYSAETRNAPIMEMSVAIDTVSIPTIIGDYCLLDIAAYYHFDNPELCNVSGKYAENNKPISLVSFIAFEREEEWTNIEHSSYQKTIKFLSDYYAFANPLLKNSFYGYNYNFLAILERQGLKVEIENNREVIKTIFNYRQDYESSYYDDIETCIIQKTFSYSDNLYDHYDAIFDYEKIVKMLSLLFTDQSLYYLKPPSSDLLSFYKQSIVDISYANDAKRTSIGTIYDTYKQNYDGLEKLLENKYTYELALENYYYHCYYIQKDAYDEVINSSKNWEAPSLTNLLNTSTGLIDFLSGSNAQAFSEETMKQSVMEMTVNSELSPIPKQLGDYHLLDIVSYYHFYNGIGGTYNPSFEYRKLIDFMDYEIKDGYVYITKANSKSILKYFSYTFANPKQYLYNNDAFKYGYLADLAWSGYKIENEFEKEIIKTTFAYRKDYEASYYDDIETCIIQKTYSKTDNLYDYYEVVFDFEKITNMLQLI